MSVVGLARVRTVRNVPDPLDADAIAHDPITGRRSVTLCTPGKPTPPVLRVPALSQDCPLCVLAAGNPRAGDRVVEGGQERLVGPSGEYCVSVPNRWNALGVLSDPYLVFTRVHTGGVEDLSVDAAAELGRCMAALALHSSYPYAAMVINVGANAGASLEHVHGQVVLTHLPTQHPGPREVDADNTKCRVCQDLEAGRTHRSVITGGDVTVYVPRAPGMNFEIRAAVSHHPGAATAEACADIMVGVRDTLAAAARRGHRWPYNVLLYAGPHPYGRILVRHDAGVLHSQELGIVPVTVDPVTLARELAAATAEP